LGRSLTISPSFGYPLPMVIFAMLLAGTMQAASPAAVHPKVQAAVSHYHELAYEEALPLLKQALKKKKLSGDDQIIALAYLARIHAVYRRHDRAVKVFVRLLERSPDFLIDETESTLIRQAFTEARDKLGLEPLTTTAQPAVPAPDDPPATVAAPDSTAETSQPSATSPDSGLPSVEEDDSNMVWWIGLGGGAAAVVAATLIGVLATRTEPAPAGSLGRWRLR